MSDSNTPPLDTDQSDTPAPYKQRRASRYQKSQARRMAQERSDQRFYNGMFSLIGFTALMAILLGAIGINGFGVDTSGMAGWTSPWIGPFSKLELSGLLFIGLISLAVYLKMRKRG